MFVNSIIGSPVIPSLLCEEWRSGGYSQMERSVGKQKGGEGGRETSESSKDGARLRR